ncbi:MAG: tetratricopeptide repeat protein [Woeseiaceae bacterium]|nr:tetratricopeptide repeat protein [Woeseiaceae bacterium]
MHPDSRQLPAPTWLACLALICAGPLAADDAVEVGGHLLAAEVAMEADNYREAVAEYLAAARLSTDVEIAQRATRLGFEYGFNEEALEAAKRWRELAPDDDAVHRVIALLELRAGNLRAARRSYEAIIEAAPGRQDRALAALLSEFANEDAENADRLMRMLAKPYPHSPEVNYASAVLALQAGDVEYADEKVRRALELDDDFMRAHLLYARILLVKGEQDAAIEYTARLVGNDPMPDPDARMELALMYLAAGREDDALSQVNQVLLEDSARTDALRLMAIINFRQGHLDAAWADFEDLLASRQYTMDALYYLARIADLRGDVDQAIQLYSEVRTGQNAVPAQRRASALIAFEQDDPNYALQRLFDFADQEPGFAVDMLFARAQLLDALDRDEEALATYDKVIGYRPDDESLALSRAELLLRMGRLEDAIGAYRKAVKRWPESPLSLNALGYTLADRTDRYREAEKLIRKALKYDPDSPAIIDSLGWVLYKLGDYEAALEQLEIAYDAFPDPEVASHLVDVLVELGRRDEALELLEQAEERDPGHELLEDVRERRFPAAD